MPSLKWSWGLWEGGCPITRLLSCQGLQGGLTMKPLIPNHIPMERSL